jgi:hypothetical protein
VANKNGNGHAYAENTNCKLFVFDVNAQKYMTSLIVGHHKKKLCRPIEFTWGGGHVETWTLIAKSQVVISIPTAKFNTKISF